MLLPQNWLAFRVKYRVVWIPIFLKGKNNSCSQFSTVLLFWVSGCNLYSHISQHDQKKLSACWKYHHYLPDFQLYLISLPRAPEKQPWLCPEAMHPWCSKSKYFYKGPYLGARGRALGTQSTLWQFIEQRQTSSCRNSEGSPQLRRFLR